MMVIEVRIFFSGGFNFSDGFWWCFN